MRSSLPRLCTTQHRLGMEPRARTKRSGSFDILVPDLGACPCLICPVDVILIGVNWTRRARCWRRRVASSATTLTNPIYDSLSSTGLVTG